MVVVFAYRFVSSLPTMSPIFGQCMGAAAADKEGASSCAIVCGVGFATGNKGNLFAGSTRCVRVFIIFSIAIGTSFFFAGGQLVPTDR